MASTIPHDMNHLHVSHQNQQPQRSMPSVGVHPVPYHPQPSSSVPNSLKVPGAQQTSSMSLSASSSPAASSRVTASSHGHVLSMVHPHQHNQHAAYSHSLTALHSHPHTYSQQQTQTQTNTNQVANANQFMLYGNPAYPNPSYTVRRRPTDVLKKYRIENESFRLWSYYKPSSKKLLGRGGYGVVMEAVDTRNNQKVAIKKMKNVFAHLNTAKCSLRELTLMMHFDHPNIINVTDCMLPDDKHVGCYQQVYYVMPKMQSTLKNVCCYSDIDVSCNHRCFILYQILSGVLYIHQCDVIHRDLKPENILINSDCTIKITDFGMARGIQHNDSEDEVSGLSEYVTTRWYRAPEIMLCSRQYKYSVDVWSIACIYCEMILRKPIFAGNNHLEQLEIIFEAIGTPNFGECKQWIKSYDALRWVLSLPIKQGKSFENDIFHYPKQTKCKDVHKNELDLLKIMFVLNPNRRASVRQCLSHRFFKKIPAKIKSLKEVDEFKNVKKFDTNQQFERQLTKLDSCRHGMLRTLEELHLRQDRKK